MKIIITSGSTYSPIDDVRGITNLSKGTTGAKLAEEALKRGHSVDYISNKESRKPFEKTINPLTSELELAEIFKNKKLYENNLNLIQSNNFEDYYKNCCN